MQGGHHRTVTNILNKMPKSLHTKAKRALQEIWMAEIKKDAVKAFDAFVETLGPSGKPDRRCRTWVKFAPDSVLEESGFELSVPPERKAALDRFRRPSVTRRQA